MILLLYLNVVTISKDFNRIFFFFSKLPSKSILSRPSIKRGVDTNRNPNPKTAFFKKKKKQIEPDPGTDPDPDLALYWHPSQRKSNASPINLWNKNLGQLKLRVSDNWKHLRFSRDLQPLNLQLYWWIQKIVLDVTIAISFSKGEVILVCESELWTLPLRAYLFTFTVFVAVIIYLQTKRL